MFNIMDINDYQRQLDTVCEWIKVADQKISIFMAIIIGTASFFSNQLGLLFFELDAKGIFYKVVLSAWTATLIWMFSKLLFALSPSLKNKGMSYLYFGHVAKLEMSEFSKKISTISKNKYKKELIEQIYSNSVIAERKHKQFGETVIILIVNMLFLSTLLIIRSLV